MNEVKFTPWTAERDDSGGEIGLWSVVDAVGNNIVFFGMEKDEALLFASGPNMLAALETAQAALAMMIEPNSIEKTTLPVAFAQAFEAEVKARAAIARARGAQS